MRLLIKNATIIDGSGENRYKGSIYIEGERIKKIYPQAKNEKYVVTKGLEDEARTKIKTETRARIEIKTEAGVEARIKVIDDEMESVMGIEEAIDEVIDGSGLICAPGFIDTHSHSDLKVLSEPNLLPKLQQGITTEVLGQDGISMAPLPFKYIGPWQKNLAGLDGEDERRYSKGHSRLG